MGIRGSKNKGKSSAPPALTDAVENALTDLVVAEFHAQIDAIFHGTKDLRERVILSFRLRELLLKFQREIEPDVATLERHRAATEQAQKLFNALCAQEAESKIGRDC
jgi:hypothetical protein